MRIGTIGTGFIVEHFLSAVAQIPDMNCTAIYSRTRENAEKVAWKFEIDTIYTDLNEMLADESINFVYVASPNSLHYDHVRQALEMGKNVICEKPFTSTTKEAKELIDLAKDKNLFLFEAITTIHLPNFALLRNHLDSLGRIRLVQASYSQYSSRYDKLLSGELPNVFNPEFSGGALMDLGIYNLHFIIYLFGKPQNVQYYANKHSNGIDTSGSLIMEYPDFIATSIAGKDTKGEDYVQIKGEYGYLYVYGGANGIRGFSVHLNSGLEETVDGQDNSNLVYYELLNFQAIYANQDQYSCYTLLDHTEAVMEVTEAARRSANITFPADKT